MNRRFRFSLRALLVLTAVVAAVSALVAESPNFAVVAMLVGCVWAVEALIVAKAGRRISQSRSWAAPLIVLGAALALLAILAQL